MAENKIVIGVRIDRKQAEADLRAWGGEVTLLSDAEKQKFRDAVQPLYDQFSEQAEMIRRIQQA